jgi:hypothetical protein
VHSGNAGIHGIFASLFAQKLPSTCLDLLNWYMTITYYRGDFQDASLFALIFPRISGDYPAFFIQTGVRVSNRCRRIARSRPHNSIGALWLNRSIHLNLHMGNGVLHPWAPIVIPIIPPNSQSSKVTRVK